MPETACLHIQARDCGPTRVVALAGSTARIGGAPSCEVCLDEPGLAAEVCSLRRRGGAWHLVPGTAADLVELHGQAVERPRPLPYGIPFRVGDCRLTLRPAGAEPADWATARTPVAVESPPTSLTTPVGDQAQRHRDLTRGAEVPGPPETALETDTGQRPGWRDRDETRDRWLKSRRDQQGWEARWRAAGERLRAQATAPRPSLPAVPPNPPPQAVASTDRGVASSSGRVAPRRPGIHVRRVPRRPDPAAPAPVVPVPDRPASGPDERTAGTALARQERTDCDGGPEVAPALATPPPRPSEAPPQAVHRLGWATPAEAEPLHAVDAEIEPVTLAYHDRFVTDTTEGEASDWPGPDAPAEVGPVGASSFSTHGPTRPDPEWPSARQIFEAHRGHRARQEAAAAALRPAAARAPLLTVAREPRQWVLPLRWTWLPALAGAIVLGGAGITLAWIWSVEDLNAGLVADRLAQVEADPRARPSLDTPEPPGQLSWWRTTAGNLVLWALSLDRSATGPEQVEQVESLVTAARQASPAQAAARFAAARPAGGARAATPLFLDLGLSRDVVALTWTGHRLLTTGRQEAALRAYRAALSMAAEAEPARLAAPSFLDDPQPGRYALPGEDLVGPVVRDLAEHGGPYAQWSAALPPSALVALAAVRVLRERSSPDAEAALDALLAHAEGPLVGPPLAVQRAAQAEALALRSKWREAEDAYQQAIDALPDGPVRRSWYVNLAAVEQQLNDEAKRREALEAAKGADAKGEVAHRAAELLSRLSGSNRK